MENRILLRAACLSGVVVMLVGGGCDHPSQSSAPTTKPVVVSSTTAPVEMPATMASYPVRPPSVLTLDGRDVSFPGAKLALLNHGGGGFTLRLCSDDPPTAIDPGYVGNSYVMDMRLSIDHLSELPAATWDFKHGDGNDSASGIYVHGYQEQYRPDDVHVSFARDGDEMLTYVSGTFLHSDGNNPGAAPERVQVNGCLRTEMPKE
jgi:hypothetical protein